MCVEQVLHEGSGEGEPEYFWYEPRRSDSVDVSEVAPVGPLQPIPRVRS